MYVPVIHFLLRPVELANIRCFCSDMVLLYLLSFGPVVRQAFGQFTPIPLGLILCYRFWPSFCTGHKALMAHFSKYSHPRLVCVLIPS